MNRRDRAFCRNNSRTYVIAWRKKDDIDAVFELNA